MSPLRALLLSAALILISQAALANETPIASFSAHRLPGEAETVVAFDASASSDPDGRVVRYQWVFGDGTTGSGPVVEHTFPRADRYNVTLLATDNGGSWHMITETIDVLRLPTGPSETGESEAPAFARKVTPADVPTGNKVGQRAPDFALPTLTGNTVNLSDFLGQVVVLEFWKSTCPSCRASTPNLEALRRTYGDQGLVIVLISLDGSARDTQRFLEGDGYTKFVVVRETRPVTFGTIAAYGVRGTPTAFLIDRTGVIRYVGMPSGLTTSGLVSSLL